MLKILLCSLQNITEHWKRKMKYLHHFNGKYVIIQLHLYVFLVIAVFV